MAIVNRWSWTYQIWIWAGFACWLSLLLKPPVLLAADSLPLHSLQAMPQATLPTEVIQDLRPLIAQRVPASLLMASRSAGRDEAGVILADLYFDDQWAWMAGEASDTLEHATRLLQTRALWDLQLEGYCDSRGNSAYALALAGRRSQAVQDHLLHLGLPPSHLRLINFGEHPSGCRASDGICKEDRHRLSLIFRLLAMSQSRRGCVIRLRLLRRNEKVSAPSSLDHSDFLQRIRLASPSPTDSPAVSMAH